MARKMASYLRSERDNLSSSKAPQSWRNLSYSVAKNLFKDGFTLALTSACKRDKLLKDLVLCLENCSTKKM